MLWTQHNRACEALRKDAVISDPDAIRIYGGIEYDFNRLFEEFNGSHAARSVTIGRVLEHRLETYPNGMTVSVGEGLETQRWRVVADAGFQVMSKSTE
jgi:O-methyltransferase involved in polyketide biosynthesis